MANPLASVFYESLDRCLLSPGFLKRFYELFLASSPEVRQKFQHVDMTRQRQVLHQSLKLTLMAAYGTPESTRGLQGLAETHSRQARDIPPHLYQLWLDALIKAAEEHDPQFTPDLVIAWRDMLTPAIQFIVARYDNPVHPR
ncbi:MAG TPA: globin [Gemmatimonadales bacterium]|nr:globin [Gemmatimonadales bacterium]